MTWQERKIRSCPALVEAAASTNDLAADARTWLQKQAVRPGGNLPWLLAHADDGVIWGRLESDNTLRTARDAAEAANDRDALVVCPELRARTLQQARLFGPTAELLLWRDGDGQFHARLLRDAGEGEAPDYEQAFDEGQLLWDDPDRSLAYDFTLLRDGAQGLRHAVPLALAPDKDGKTKTPRLVVRYYLNRGGFARVVASRLVDLVLDPTPEKKIA